MAHDREDLLFKPLVKQLPVEGWTLTGWTGRSRPVSDAMCCLMYPMVFSQSGRLRRSALLSRTCAGMATSCNARMVRTSSSVSVDPASIRTTPRSHRGRYARVSAAPPVASRAEPRRINKGNPLGKARYRDGDGDTCHMLYVIGVVLFGSKLPDCWIVNVFTGASANDIVSDGSSPWMMCVGTAVTGVTPTGSTSYR